MGNLDRLDFDITGDAFPKGENVKMIDVYGKSSPSISKEVEIDEYIVFSSDLIKCFKSKVKKSPAKLRVDSLIETYKSAEESYVPNSTYNLPTWCMANVNRFLSVAEGKDFNVSTMDSYVTQAKEELKELNLEFNFESVNDLYIETRKESIQNIINYRLEREF
tara:strand:+ start:572 stop:1060 length:489 start_codon:yes stop_codon:yes gene_type:complete